MIAINKNFSDLFFSSQTNERERRAKKAGKRVRKRFGRFYQRMKKMSRLLNARSRGVVDLNQFNQDNADIPNTLRVSVQNDSQWARRLLVMTFLFESFLSYKGAQFLLETFLALSIPIVTLAVAVIIAYFAITQSITMRHFAKRYQKENNMSMHYVTAVGSYLLVFIIPTANILEGFNTIALNPEGLPSQYQTFNILMVLLTLGVHLTLINMADVFIEAENAKKAGELRDRKTKAIKAAENMVEKYSVKYEAAREAFNESVRDFVGSYLDLRGSHEDAAQRILNHFDVRLIWLINRIFGHKVLQYPTNEEGQIESTEPFSAELRGMAEIMDEMDTITVSTGIMTDVRGHADGINGREGMLPETGQPEFENGTPVGGKAYDAVFSDEPEVPKTGEVEHEGGINPLDKEL